MGYAEQDRAGLKGGLHLLESPDAVPADAFPDLGNVRVGAGGRVYTRRSAVLIGAFPTAPEAVAGYLPAPASVTQHDVYAIEDTGYPVANGTSQLVFAAGAVYRSVTSRAGTTSISTTPLAHVFPANAPAPPRIRRPLAANFVDTVKYAPATRGFVVAVFGEAAPISIDSTTDAVATITHADWVNSYPTCVASYAGRVWFAGSEDYPARVWATDVGAVDTFTVNATPQPSDSFFIDLDLVDGGRIVAMQHLYDVLLVFTTHGVYRISPLPGQPIPYKVNFLSTHSCYSPHAVIKVDNGVVFLSQAGVFSAIAALTYGDVQFNELSPQLGPLFRGLEAWQLAGAFMTYDPVEYSVSLFIDHNYPFAHRSAAAPVYTAADAQADLANPAVKAVYSPATTERFMYHMRGRTWVRDFLPVSVKFAVNRAEPSGRRVTEAYTTEFDTGPLGGTRRIIVEYELDSQGALAVPGQDLIFNMPYAGTPYDQGVYAPFTSYVRTREETFGAQARRKHHVFLDTDMVSGAARVFSAFDRGAWREADATQQATAGRTRFPLLGSGRRVQAEYRASGAAFELGGYAFTLGAGGRR